MPTSKPGAFRPRGLMRVRWNKTSSSAGRCATCLMRQCSKGRSPFAVVPLSTSCCLSSRCATPKILIWCKHSERHISPPSSTNNMVCARYKRYWSPCSGKTVRGAVLWSQQRKEKAPKRFFSVSRRKAWASPGC